MYSEPATSIGLFASYLCMKRLLIIILCLPLLLSCHKMMDPYTGGDGVRANINGSIYALFGKVGSKEYADAGIADQYRRFVLKAPLVSTVYGKEPKYILSIDLLSMSALETETEYALSDKASIQTANGEKSSLTGWIRFTLIDLDKGIIEARFELHSPQFSVRHGFLRLPMTVSVN